MNMVNFLDGMDGLAAGVCGIAGVTFAILALSLGKPDPAILSAIVAGACLGFLRHNFFPARIFMGDSGALCLGFILAAVSIQGLLKTASTVVLFLPLLVLAVPIIDTSFVVARRLKHSRPIYTADRSHLHHRFLNIGFSQRRAAVTMWLWCASLAGAALATRFVPFREGGEWHLWETLAVARDRALRASRSRSTSSTCSRSSSSRTRASGVASANETESRERHAAPSATLARSTKSARRSLKSGVALDDVAVAREHDALRGELALEDVADRVERRVVRARDDELRERRRRERVERDLGLPRATLDRRAPARPARAPAGAVRAGRTREPTAAQEPAQERLGVARRARRVERRTRRRRTRRPPGCPRRPRRRRLDHGQRAEPLGPRRRGEQRDDAAVRVPDEVVAGLEQVGDEPRVRLEVDAIDRRIRREAGTVERRRARTARRAAAAPPRSRARPTTLPWTRTSRSICDDRNAL